MPPLPYLPVVSISRRTDMVRWYPGDMVRLLDAKYPPDKTHSLVVVTKFPAAVLASPAREALARYEQVVVQVTITGLGSSPLEPRVPPPGEALRVLPSLVAFTGSPERVLVRIDPIVHWREGRLANGGDPGPVRSNVDLFAEVAAGARAAGITRIKTSLASPYPKVIRRFQAAGLELVTLTGAEKEAVLRHLEREAAEAGLALEYCCEETRPSGACIDPALLTRLHPRRLPARPDRAAGQRAHCGCGHSVDLAWYSTHPCPSGCLYCYANPIVGRAREGS